jgi:hypothetical protein
MLCVGKDLAPEKICWSFFLMTTTTIDDDDGGEDDDEDFIR